MNQLLNEERRMNDIVAISSRAAADKLASVYNQELEGQVEAALDARRSANRLERYVDPVSVGSLIVSVASLAWTVYAGLKKQTPNPALESVSVAVRARLAEGGETTPAADSQMIEIVVTEIIQAASDSE